MRVGSVRRGASGSAIVAAGGSSYCVLPEQLEELGLSLDALIPGTELGEEEAAVLQLAAEAREAEQRGLALLARAEQSTFMLRLKLEARDFSKPSIELALSHLNVTTLLDDRRFARSYISARLAKNGGRPEGPTNIVAGLRERGIDRETAASALAEVLGPDERKEALLKAVQKLNKRGIVEQDELRRALHAFGFRSGEIAELFETLYP
jgi:SOS response regulatory protein OraA/RecX